MNLYIVHVESTLENGFTAGCHTAVWAGNAEKAEEIAYNEEAESVGSDDKESGRTTSVGIAKRVPDEAIEFIREIFYVR